MVCDDQQVPKCGYAVDDPTPPPPYSSNIFLSQPPCSSLASDNVQVKYYKYRLRCFFLQVPNLHPSSVDDASCSSLPAEPDPGCVDEDIVMRIPEENVGGGGGEEEEVESTEDGEQQQLSAENIDDPVMDLSSCPSTPKVNIYFLVVFILFC